jgi:uncharacterized membrane protein SpoIIM required for sporulation
MVTMRAGLLWTAGSFVAGSVTGAVLMCRTDPVAPGADPVHVDVVSVATRNVAVLICLAAGSLTFGLATLLVLFLNGAVLGAAVVSLAGTGHGADLWGGLAPHFIPEVSAFLLGASADLWLAAALARWLCTGARPACRLVLRRWALPQLIAVLLIGLAAVLETYVSVGPQG